jgi:hypothetical protein
MAQTRFRFVDGITDTQDPTKKWSVDTSVPYTSFGEDYALVTRMLDSTTGGQVVVAAGITRYGTVAAGEFLTDPARMQDLIRIAPRDWSHKNMQVVLKTRVVGDNSGPPQIVATWFW